MNAPQIPYRTFDVPVEGGVLRTAQWGSAGPVVLCVHGITANHTEFALFASELGHTHRLVAPDLRGRGRSNKIPGPWGMAAHAADLVAVLDHLHLPRADVLVGHSMGGFVATALATSRPELVRALVLVDGGLPFPPADEAATVAGLQPIKQRLRSTFTREGYRDWFRLHPAFARNWTPEVEEYADYDLPESPGRPAADPDMVDADQLDMVRGTAFADALDKPMPPRVFLHASRGFADDPPGLYPQQSIDQYAARWPDLGIRHVPDVNHYTIVLSRRGAGAVAQAVSEMLWASP